MLCGPSFPGFQATQCRPIHTRKTRIVIACSRISKRALWRGLRHTRVSKPHDQQPTCRPNWLVDAEAPTLEQATAAAWTSQLRMRCCQDCSWASIQQPRHPEVVPDSSTAGIGRKPSCCGVDAALHPSPTFLAWGTSVHTHRSIVATALLCVVFPACSCSGCWGLSSLAA